MSKLLKTIVAAALALFANSAMAGVFDYVSAQGAVQSVTGADSNGTAVVVNFGKSLDDKVKGLAIEGEATKTLSEASTTGTYLGVSYKSTVSFTTLAGYAVYNLPVAQSSTVKFKAGMRHMEATVSSSTVYGSGSATSSDDAAAYGVGFVQTLTDKLRFQAEYTKIDADATNISAGIQVRF